MKSRLAVPLAALLASGALIAQEPPAPPTHTDGAATLTLADAVERALAHHPGVEAARARQDEAKAALAEATAAAHGPRGRITGSATQYEKPIPVTPIHGFGPGQFPEFDTTLLQGTLGVNYTLWDGGASGARIRAAETQVGGAEVGVGSAEQAVAQQVATAYLTALGRGEVLAAHDLRLVALRGELSRSQLRFDAGKAARVEVLRAEAALASAEADRVGYATALDNAERELARLLDAPVEETRASRLAPVALATELPPRETLAEQGIAASPAVEQARRQILSAEAQIAVERSATRPELRAVGNLNDLGSKQGDFSSEWNAGLQITVPLFDGGVTRSRIARAEAARREAGEQLRLAELQVRSDVDRAAAATEQALARAASLDKAVQRFAEVARIQKLLLDAGAGTQIDYLNAEADLLSARASLADARNAAALARTDLARATGQLGPDWLRHNLRPQRPQETAR
jgi:outer membrane protein